MNKGKYDAQRYILPEGMATKEVCPVDQNSLAINGKIITSNF